MLNFSLGHIAFHIHYKSITDVFPHVLQFHLGQLFLRILSHRITVNIVIPQIHFYILEFLKKHTRHRITESSDLYCIPIINRKHLIRRYRLLLFRLLGRLIS